VPVLRTHEEHRPQPVRSTGLVSQALPHLCGGREGRHRDDRFPGNATSEKAFALANRARATPTFLFFDLDGNPATRFTGATQTPEEFMLLGRYVVEGAYKTQPFNVYKKQSSKP